jgi:hypothetical protein
MFGPHYAGRGIAQELSNAAHRTGSGRGSLSRQGEGEGEGDEMIRVHSTARVTPQAQVSVSRTERWIALTPTLSRAGEGGFARYRPNAWRAVSFAQR